MLTVLSFGFGTREVADELHVSYHTVRNHIRNACRNPRDEEHNGRSAGRPESWLT